MARTMQDAKLDSRASRLKLKVRREPYWRTLSEGIAIGYRKGAKGGTWIARHYSEEHGRRFKALGTSDDVADADNVTVLNFGQAQEAARKWFGDLARMDGGGHKDSPYSVNDAMADYVQDYKRRGKKAVYDLEVTIKAYITPKLGDKPISKLTRRQIEAWLEEIVSAAPRVRTKAGTAQKYRKMPENQERLRRRRSTANRILTVLKAALNLAYQNSRATNRDTWEMVKPYREVDAPKIRYINDDEARRFVNACSQDLRPMAIAALLTGCRYGELAALKAMDFNPDSGTIHIARSKSGKPRHIVLTDEGRQFFTGVTANKKGNDIIFFRETGAKWNHASQFRPVKEACKAANITPAISFHILRHTYASRLAMQGVPMAVIATQLGHSDTRMTEKHYAHLAPSYVADTVRAAFTAMGIVGKSKVVPLSTSIKNKKKQA